MSPGATFERVYTELKRMLVAGELPPGTPIEPALIGRQIASSITPVRDALHRLTGERLVEAPNHNGFRVPLPTEAGLRDLYDWNGQILKSAVQRTKPAEVVLDNKQHSSKASMVAATEWLFMAIVRRSGNLEQARAIEQLNDRLAPYRRAEVTVFNDIVEEFEGMRLMGDSPQLASFAKLLDKYHRRRAAAAPSLLRQIVEGV
ncbi:GntR family transcriptional regulator [Sphingomonas sp. 179-A 2A2 NHS]|uniref:GntR family transcriptional regulator n=1 Tax=Sphingomonas sp. 179-A 2A2 NHS TaxID=3374290 RepID=UPI00387A4003